MLKTKNKLSIFIASLFTAGIFLWVIQLGFDWFSADPPYFFSNGVFHQDVTDAFADFFNINRYIQDFSPYLNGNDSSYPPFNFLIALPFSLIPNRWASLTLLLILYALLFGVLVFLFWKKYKPSPFFTVFTVVISVLSSPLLFLIERGNYVFFTFFFVAIFLLYYDAESKKLRWLSYLALAMAVAMKMYPAVFALLLLKQKRYKDVIVTATLSIFFFIAPFFIMKGGFLPNVQGFLTNLQSFGSYQRLAIDVSVGNFFRILAYLLGADYLAGWVGNVALCARALLFVGGCLLALLAKERWQSITLLSLMVVIVPMPAMIHSLIYTISGFAMWSLQKKQRNLNYWYAILFFLLLTPLQFGYIIEPIAKEFYYPNIYISQPNYIGLSVNTFLQGLGVILLTVTLCADIAHAWIKARKTTASSTPQKD